MYNEFPNVEVEMWLTELIREYPMARVLADVLPKSPNFHNADFLFDSEKIVAELKILTDDNTDSANNIAKRTELINQFYSDGIIPSTIIDESNWYSLPLSVQTRISDISTRSIAKAAQKANRQIRETREELGLNNYSGMLIIVNNGMRSISPAAIQLKLARLMEWHFSEIHHVIFFTSNLFIRLKEVERPVLVWLSMDCQKGRKIDERFAVNLHKLWMSMVSRKTGIPSNAKEITDMEDFWKAQHK